ncbi:MAG: succinylglutamate desuccinylase/aspartoacylase family protein [Rhodobacteraceae bacterium]|nr:succinylglutamate desuccinylase/aspartoacylase family protein [Paracoccaceae bacterium]
MLTLGPVRTGMDFDAPGKRAGFLDVDHSDNRLAFSSLRVPVGVIRGGPGPTVILSAGSHGDEYEGQVILHRLMQGLHPADVAGRLIVLPALNLPAVLGRARVSPLDGGNMNRAFPGAPGAGPTAAIAAFVDRHLLPMADAAIDFHSGGSATDYAVCGFVCQGPDSDLNQRNLALAEAFGAPFTMVCPIDGTGGDFDTAAHLRGVRFLACELGGSGRFDPAACAVGWAGCLGVLHALGCLAAPVLPRMPTPAATPAPGGAGAATRFLDIGAAARHVTAAHHGLAEIDLLPGDAVAAGDVLGRLHDLHDLGAPPRPAISPCDGVLAVRRCNPLVAPGDHLCLISPEIPRDAVLRRFAP